MKKYLNIAMIYMFSAFAAGVFFREFTKWQKFTGVTALAKVHTHLFVLGMFLFLIVALFAGKYDLPSQKSFRVFMLLHSIALPLTAVMMLLRGVLQVLRTELSRGADAAISGVAGIGHLLLAAGLTLLLIALRTLAKD